MKYSEIVTYINDIPKFTKKNSMDHTRRFMEFLGIREEKFRIIHVAGTNGKGSSCAYLSEMLHASGASVGLFTSPHLECITERIRIDGTQISRENFECAYERVMEAVGKMEAICLSHPTFFEFLFGMAMCAFDENHVEYIILETGLGGRLDATNVFSNPMATIITSIGLDHEYYLGDTIEKIAMEKAGIIKKNCPVIYDGHNKSVCQVIESRAIESRCLCKKISDSAYEITEKTEKYIAFYLKDEYDKHVTWKIKNRGMHQVDNAVLAITALRMIVPEANQDVITWKNALYQTAWPGRMEEVEEGIFLDGAHNVAAIEAIAKDNRRVDVLLFSAVSDKNYHDMIRKISEQIEADTYIITTIDDKRGVEASELLEVMKQFITKPIYVETSIEAAWRRLKECKPEGGKALCLGSLYLVGMIKKLLQK